jgi:pimeloyl-ACP methyl ester carboxylesterase
MESIVATEPSLRGKGRDRPSRPDPRSRGNIGWIVAGSLATGLVAAVLLAVAPFIPAEESAVTGAVLCGFALGWAMLAVLSVRFTDQPQRWAAAPALLMGVGGLLLVSFGSPVHQVLNWVWPPAMLVLAVWVLVCVHRQLPSRGGRWLLYPVIAVLALASIGGGYQTLGEAADAKAYPMPGQLIEVGGHRLHLSCTGAGTPTVVLEPGAGGMSSMLGWIAPAVARDTRVCVYDRAGRGWSEPADSAQDGAQIATDLHTLLQRGHVPGPYVLAGHSFGGLYVLTFAARYPEEVAGMVLVDSTAPASAANQGTPSPGHGAPPTACAGSRHWCRPRLDWVSAACTPSPTSAACRRGPGTRSAPASPRPARFAARSTSTSRRRPRPSKPPPSVTSPTSRIVLTAGSGHDAAWSAAQNRMTRLSTNSAHRIVDGATHEDLIVDQDDAAATTQAILDVVSAVRSKGALVS